MAILLLMAVSWLMAPPVSAHDGSHDTDCGGPQIIIEGGNPSPFSLPNQGDETLEIAPEAILTIRGINLPADAALHWRVRGLGAELAGKFVDISSGVTTINVADFSSHARRVYLVEGILFSGPIELCSISFEADITGFSGTTAIAASGVAAVAGVGTGGCDPAGRHQPSFPCQRCLASGTGRRRQFWGQLLYPCDQDLPETASGGVTSISDSPTARRDVQFPCGMTGHRCPGRLF